jgi:hypothetical protein
MENKREARFEIHGNEDSTFTIVTDGPSTTGTVEDLDALISALAQLRSMHPKPVSIDPPWLNPTSTHVSVESVDNPRFWVHRTAMQDGAMLSLRHPGHGWLSFVIPEHELKSMTDLLQRQLDAPQSSGTA